MSVLMKGAFSVPGNARPLHPDTQESPVCPTTEARIRAAADRQPPLSPYALGMYALMLWEPFGACFTVADLIDPEDLDTEAQSHQIAAALRELVNAELITAVTA
uniref:hypothetical protein n=1 Tax=Nonomuraea sp. CA-251285 TaxID=3240002 RepID=UPI003F4929C0